MPDFYGVGYRYRSLPHALALEHAGWVAGLRRELRARKSILTTLTDILSSIEFDKQTSVSLSHYLAATEFAWCDVSQIDSLAPDAFMN